MNSRLKIRLEAARIAAQLGPQSAADLVKQSKTIEKYILGKAQLPEYISIEEAVKMNIEEGMNAILKKEKAEIDDIGKRLDEAYECALKKHYEQGSCLGAVPEENAPSFGTDKQMHPHDNVETNPFLPDTVLAVDRLHDPTFKSRLMKVFADYPATGKDLAQVTRERQELYHDLGIAAEPFNNPNRHPECPATQGIVYLAPGGMPSADAESIYLQENGEKVE